MGGMSDVRGAGDPRGEPADRDHAAAAGQLLQEQPRGVDLAPGRESIRRLCARVGRDDVPAEDVQVELSEDPPDDGRRRLGGAAAGELTLGGERETGDSGAPVACRLADEQNRGLGAGLEVRGEPGTAERRAGAVAVEVERRSDPSGCERVDEPFRLHVVTMLMPVRGRIAALAVAGVGVCVPSSYAAPPQGVQSDAAFAASYTERGVTSVVATTQRVSCYTPAVVFTGSLAPSQGYPDGGSTLCGGSATTGENLGPYPSQGVSNAPHRVKDFSESDLRVDPTNPSQLIGISKWIVNAEGYNHLTGFFESFDGGLTWPQQGHIPGYEGWTDNSDPVGAFDPWGNFYAVVLPYMFSYLRDGEHFFLSPDVNPALPRSGLGVAVRVKGAATPASWSVMHDGTLDMVARTPFNGSSVFDKQWIAVDTNRRSRHFGRVYVSWAIGTSDEGLRVYVSFADAHRNGTHTNWSRPQQTLEQTPG